MDVIRCQTHKIRSAKDFWHLDSTNKLVKYKLIVSGAACGHSHYIIWLKHSKSNKGNAAYELFKESINKNETLL